jgi:ribonuclease BN (tRNA processing enzyme)
MVMIRFKILGAGGAVPMPNYSPAAYNVVVDGFPILMDPGPGALVRLVQSGDAPRGVDDISMVLVTHLHPDHSADLIALLFALHSVVPERDDVLTLRGPRGLLNLLDKLGDIYGSWLQPRLRTLDVQEIDPGAVISLPGGGSVTAFAANHPQDRLSETALGFKFSDSKGRVAVYSGDTGPCPALEEAAQDCDLLVVECSTPDELATKGHLSTSQVGALCARCQPQNVVLTHQYPAAAALDLPGLVGQIFKGPVHQARDGDCFIVPPGTKESS